MKIAVAFNHPLAGEWSTKHGWEIVDTTASSLKEASADLIILDFLQPYFHWDPREWSNSVELRQVSYRADCVMRSQDMWVGRSLMQSASAVLFKHFEVRYSPDKWVYLSGSFETIQNFMSLLFDRGYRAFRILDLGGQESQIQSKIRDLEMILMGVRAESFPVDKMVLQKPVGSIFVFSQGNIEYTEALKLTISYFNFLSPGGLVINLCSEKESWLKTEALATDLKYVTEFDFYRLTEWQVLKLSKNPNMKFRDVYA
jgi:hypothetical protein